MSGDSATLPPLWPPMAWTLKGSVHWNLGWESLHETAVELGEAKLTADGVLLATTGERTGRSPNDRFIVDEVGMAEDVLWGEVNRPTAPAVSRDC